MQNEMTLCGILIGVMAFFMIVGMIGIRKEKREMQESGQNNSSNSVE